MKLIKEVIKKGHVTLYRTTNKIEIDTTTGIDTATLYTSQLVEYLRTYKDDNNKTVENITYKIRHYVEEIPLIYKNNEHNGSI